MALRIIFDDYESYYKHSYPRNNSHFVYYQQKLYGLLIEMHSTFSRISKSTFKHFFYKMSVCSKSEILMQLMKIVNKGQNSLIYYYFIVWNSVLIEIKRVSAPEIFKQNIKRFKPKNSVVQYVKTL